MAIKPIVVSYSELDTFRQCPLKHALGYRERWSKPPKEGSALSRGTLYHKVMEAHFTTIMDLQNRKVSDQETLLRNAQMSVEPLIFDLNTGEVLSDMHDLIWWMYQGYVERWGSNPEWRIKAIEHPIQVPLRDDRGRRSQKYFIKAKLDLIVQDLEVGGLWVVDHKSGANLPTKFALEIDDQFGLYTWMMREVGKPVVGSIHMANRTQRNKSFMPLDTRMDKFFLNRSEAELNNIALDAWHAARAAYPPAGSIQPKYSSPDPRQCEWKCDFKEVHLLMRTGRPAREVLTEYGFKQDFTRH